MKTLLNIEKSGFHKGQYIGYSKHGVWRITGKTGKWCAILQRGQITTNLPFGPVLTRANLSDLSIALDML